MGSGSAAIADLSVAGRGAPSAMRSRFAFIAKRSAPCLLPNVKRRSFRLNQTPNFVYDPPVCLYNAISPMTVDDCGVPGPPDGCIDLTDDEAVLVRIDPYRGFVVGNIKLLPVRTARWLGTLSPEERRLAFKIMALKTSTHVRQKATTCQRRKPREIANAALTE